MFKTVRLAKQADNLTKKIQAVALDPRYYQGEKNEAGEPHGFGKYSYVEGDTYEGMWENGFKHGQGTWTYVNNDRYVGSWEFGHKHGKGIWYVANGDRYEGDFFNDARNGFGIYYFHTGDKYSGTYVDDIKEGHGEYIAKVSTPCRDHHISGKYRYYEGDIYVGEFHNNNRHGQGKLWSKNGDLFIGNFVDHYKSGKGVLYKDDGQIIEGLWDNDRIEMVTKVPTQSQKSKAGLISESNCNCKMYVLSGFLLGFLVGYMTKQYFFPNFDKNITLERVNPGISYIIDIS